ncbi:hypothetical protein F4808DRAFT_464185 [Astrocystis sublimbata]|nr:hypothetical protein F4808DRAFT_464185 [Astrocystis sublimbata]
MPVPPRKRITKWYEKWSKLLPDYKSRPLSPIPEEESIPIPPSGFALFMKKMFRNITHSSCTQPRRDSSEAASATTASSASTWGPISPRSLEAVAPDNEQAVESDSEPDDPPPLPRQPLNTPNTSVMELSRPRVPLFHNLTQRFMRMTITTKRRRSSDTSDDEPIAGPSQQPTQQPSQEPPQAPEQQPSQDPTQEPTQESTQEPSRRRKVRRLIHRTIFSSGRATPPPVPTPSNHGIEGYVPTLPIDIPEYRDRGPAAGEHDIPRRPPPRTARSWSAPLGYVRNPRRMFPYHGRLTTEVQTIEVEETSFAMDTTHYITNEERLPSRRLPNLTPYDAEEDARFWRQLGEDQYFQQHGW